MSIQVSSPTRVDLAGGTLDCWPLYLFVGDCWTINISINVNTKCELSPGSDKSIDIDIKDLNFQKTYANLGKFLSAGDPEISLVKEHVRYWKPDQGFKLSTQSMSPVGGGLGGSSSLSISIIKAFAEWTGKEMSPNEMVNIAHNIEAKVLKTPTGTQDYVPAVQPGLNAIRYGVDQPQFERLDFPEELFSQKMLLVYTGRPHHSGINNWQVIKSAIEGNTQTLTLLKKLAETSESLYKMCLSGDWNGLPDIFNKEFEIRSQISESFSSPEIIRLQEIAKAHGADATKICGAGGGGCVMIWCDPELKGKISASCQKEKFVVIPAEPVPAREPQ